MFGLVKGALKSTLTLAILVAGLGGYGYYRLAAGKLAAPPGTAVTIGICRATPSLSGGTLPITFEAYLKDGHGHNFLVTPRSIGLVKARYEWSHGQLAWVEDPGFAERQADAVRTRKQLASRDVASLIKELRSDDPERREIAAKELYLRTEKTLGYAYDEEKPARDQAAATWERWWANDDNRLRYGARRAIDGVDGALGTLRRALGEGEEKKK